MAMHDGRYLTLQSLIPLMGVAYFLQFLDKLALSQATLFNLRQDLVCISRTLLSGCTILTGLDRTCMGTNIHGHLRYFILDTLHGAGTKLNVLKIES